MRNYSDVPTMVEIARLDPPMDIDGTSLAPILKDPEVKVKEFAISQYPRGRSPGHVMGYSLRTESDRYTVWMGKNWVSTLPYDENLQIASELYDYGNDPLETRNLVRDPAYSDVTNGMRDRLLAFFLTQLEE